MRTLTNEEKDKVSGGGGLVGAVIGAGIGAGSAILRRQSLGSTLVAGVFGAASGFFGNLAGSAAAGSYALRASYAMRSVSHGVVSSLVPGELPVESDLEPELN